MKQDLTNIAVRFHQAGYCFYVVGDSARRLYQGQEIQTLDAWTNADILFVARTFDVDECPGEQDCSLRFPCGPWQVKLSCDPLNACRPPATSPRLLRQVAQRQCFTINSLLFDPAGDKFFDPTGCRTDIRSRVLRTTNGALAEAGRQQLARVFQAVYLESEEQFEPAGSLIEAIQDLDIQPSHELLPVIRQGLQSVLTAQRPYRGLWRLHQLGLLIRILPELEPLPGCPQDKEFHPEGDVFVHTLECFRHVRHAPLPMALGLLFHDVGKPATLTVDKHIHFPRHSSVGADIARGALRRLGFPRGLSEEVQFYIRNHLLKRVLRHLENGQLAAFVRHPWFENLLRIYRADIQGSIGDLGEYRRLIKRIEPYRARE
ncbi:MAG: HD domain-containing protein [Acidobacteria bacterium]|nr:HD domain-containing protein [Acidobacteriota bacterium]